MDKRPRHYAMECMRIETKEDRRAYLEKEVPPEYQEWVKRYVKEWWPRRKAIQP